MSYYYEAFRDIVGVPYEQFGIQADECTEQIIMNSLSYIPEGEDVFDDEDRLDMWLRRKQEIKIK